MGGTVETETCHKTSAPPVFPASHQHRHGPAVAAPPSSYLLSFFPPPSLCFPPSISCSSFLAELGDAAAHDGSLSAVVGAL